MATVIDALISRNEQIISYLKIQGEHSLALELEGNFTKLLIIACGSFFETELCECLERFVLRTSEDRIATWIKLKGIKRQYHTMFNWEQTNNCNRFLSLFGNTFKNAVEEEIRSSDAHRKALRDFITIGNERNILAHGNLAAIPAQHTLIEVGQLYASALGFLLFLCSKFEPLDNACEKFSSAKPSS